MVRRDTPVGWMREAAAGSARRGVPRRLRDDRPSDNTVQSRQTDGVEHAATRLAQRQAATPAFEINGGF